MVSWVGGVVLRGAVFGVCGNEMSGLSRWGNVGLRERGDWGKVLVDWEDQSLDV